MSILFIIVTVFILVGGLLPYVNSAFDQTGTSDPGLTDDPQIMLDISENVETVTAINAFTVIISILKMFLWSFGDLPFWLDLAVFTPMRIILALIIARNVWIGGGG